MPSPPTAKRRGHYFTTTASAAVTLLWLTLGTRLPLPLRVPTVRAFSSSHYGSHRHAAMDVRQHRWSLRTTHPLSFVFSSSRLYSTASTKTKHTNANGDYTNDDDDDDTGIDLDMETDNKEWEEEEEEDSGNNDHLEEDDEDEDDSQADPLRQEYDLWLTAISKAQKTMSKKRASLEQEASKAQTVEGTVARAQLIVNNLYLFSNIDTKQQTFTVVDWDQDGQEVELTLDTKNYPSAADEADALFAQARKLKRGSAVVQALLDDVTEAVQVLEDCQADLSLLETTDNKVDAGRLRLVQDRLRRTAKATQFKEPQSTEPASNRNKNQTNNSNKHKKKAALGTPASNVRKLLTPHGATILVGRNRRGNEYLSLTQARGNDVWMHARGTPGAHVLVLDRRGSVRPTQDCLELAAHLAAFYSDGRTESRVPITVAEPKHVVKPRGAPLGAVQVRREGYVLYGCPDSVPRDLQEARAQSGVYASAEYRSADKAKHRKRTQAAVQKQKQNKVRDQKKKKRRSNYDTGDDPYGPP